MRSESWPESRFWLEVILTQHFLASSLSSFFSFLFLSPSFSPASFRRVRKSIRERERERGNSRILSHLKIPSFQPLEPWERMWSPESSCFIPNHCSSHHLLPLSLSLSLSFSLPACLLSLVTFLSFSQSLTCIAFLTGYTLVVTHSFLPQILVISFSLSFSSSHFLSPPPLSLSLRCITKVSLSSSSLETNHDTWK